MVFDKDNTLTSELGKNFYSKEIKDFFDYNVRTHYSKKEMGVVSNFFPKKTKDSELFAKNIDIDVFNVGLKPNNFLKIKD